MVEAKMKFLSKTVVLIQGRRVKEKISRKLNLNKRLVIETLDYA